MKKCVKIFALVTAVMLAVLTMASCDVIEDVKGGIEDVTGSIKDFVSGIIPCEHSWVEANCKEAKHCELCGATEGEPADHVPETVEGYAADCENDGLTDGEKCSTCGEILTAQQTIPAKGHTSVTVKGYGSDCENDGLTDGEKCSACGDVLVVQETIPAKGHTSVTVKGYAADCENDGLADGEKCSACGDVLVVQETIPAKGHTEGAKETCTTDQVCTECGDVLVEKHHTTEVVKGYDADCENDGLTDGESCSACGEVLVAQETIPAKGHTEGPAATCTTDQVCTECGDVLVEKHHTAEVVKGYAADCENDGLTDGESCSACGEVLVVQETIPAKGHTEGPAATCTTDQICTECRKVLVKKHHTPEAVAGYAATCLDDGLTDGEKCSACGEVLVAQETIPATGHSFEDGVCTACGQEYFNEGMIFSLSPDGKFYVAESVGNITDKDIIIPATYKNLPVSEISGVFASNSSHKLSFESITIPSSIKRIRSDGWNNGPFLGCENLKKVYIESLDSWFDTVIYNNPGTNPLYYDAELYAGGELVTEVTIPDRIEQIIDTDWFCGCSSITKINFHDKVYVIDGFTRLNNLTEVTIPSSVKIVLGDSFRNCTSLANISIADKTYQIFSGAFQNTAYYNDEANWDEGNVLYVGKHLLKAKNTMEGSYTVKADTTSIAGGAFEGCSKLTGLTLNSGLVVIGNNAFGSTRQLKSLTIPYSVMFIGSYAFDGMAGSINNGYGRDITFEYTGQWYDMGDFYQNLSSPYYIYGTRSSTGVIYYVNQQPIMGGRPGISVQDHTCTYALCR